MDVGQAHCVAPLPNPCSIFVFVLISITMNCANLSTNIFETFWFFFELAFKVMGLIVSFFNHLCYYTLFSLISSCQTTKTFYTKLRTDSKTSVASDSYSFLMGRERDKRRDGG